MGWEDTKFLSIGGGGMKLLFGFGSLSEESVI